MRRINIRTQPVEFRGGLPIDTRATPAGPILESAFDQTDPNQHNSRACDDGREDSQHGSGRYE